MRWLFDPQAAARRPYLSASITWVIVALPATGYVYLRLGRHYPLAAAVAGGLFGLIPALIGFISVRRPVEYRRWAEAHRAARWSFTELVMVGIGTTTIFVGVRSGSPAAGLAGGAAIAVGLAFRLMRRS